jgi:hypothetical protein
MAMTTEEIYEYAKTHPAIGMSLSAFQRAGVDPHSLIGASPAEPGAIHRVVQAEMGHYAGSAGRAETYTGNAAQGSEREPISPEQHALNVAAVDYITRQIGRSQVQKENLSRFDAEDLAFMKAVDEEHEAHQPYMDWVLSEQKKAADLERIRAEQNAAYLKTLPEPIKSRSESRRYAPEAKIIESPNGWKPGEIEEV